MRDCQFYLGEYAVHEILGRGRFGSVYRAVDTTLNREVALKILNPLLLYEPDWLSRFQSEAEVVAALDHPRIVTVYEVDQVDGRAFIAMTLLRGPSLEAVLSKRGMLSWDRVRCVMLEVLEGLAYAHERGVLHRDLKPANIVLDADKGAVLTDFGLAHLVDDTQLSPSSIDLLVGSPHYLAPELWDEKPPSWASDLYALGCMLYEMVLGCKAFPGETAPAVMRSHFQPLRLPGRWLSEIPPGIAAVLRKVLAKDPEARYPDSEAFRQALCGLGNATEHRSGVRPCPRAERHDESGRVQAMQARMIQAYYRGYYQDAIDLCASILRVDPSHTVAKEYQVKAKDYLERGVVPDTRIPRDARFSYNRGLSLKRAGQYREAETYFTDALDIAKTEAGIDRWADAERELGELNDLILQKDLVQRGDGLAAQGEWDEAVEVYQNALSVMASPSIRKKLRQAERAGQTYRKIASHVQIVAGSLADQAEQLRLLREDLVDARKRWPESPKFRALTAKVDARLHDIGVTLKERGARALADSRSARHVDARLRLIRAGLRSLEAAGRLLPEDVHIDRLIMEGRTEERRIRFKDI
jgi:tetratricopeptide (TPR) repeat protein